MKRVILTISIIFLAIPACASSIFYEGFNSYLPGELNTQNGGTGWGTAWTAITANTEVVNPGTALSYSVPGGGTVNGGSSALQLTGNNNAQIARSISTAQTGDVYFSFLYRQSGGILNTDDMMLFWFDNNTTLSGIQNGVPNIGVKGNNGTGAGPEDFVSRVTVGFPEYSTAFVPGTDFFIVGRLFKTGAGNYDSFSLWVNPSFGDAGTPDITSTAAGTSSSFLRLGIRSANQDAADILNVDEFTAGTTWNDVVPAAITPIPEPTAFALAGIGFIGILLSRRKRSRN